MKKNAMGNGSTQCILCGDEFGLLGASSTYCDDCKKVGPGGGQGVGGGRQGVGGGGQGVGGGETGGRRGETG